MNERHFRLEVKQAAPHLAAWLQGRLPGIGLQQLESLFHQQRIWVNGQVGQAEQPLIRGDQVEIYRRYVAEIVPEALPLHIVFEDEHLIAVNKAAGMPVHPGLGHYKGTLLHALAYHYQQSGQSNLPIREAVVHRLDKDTSGLLLLAKTPTAKKQLEAQFREGALHRQYEALVWGQLVPNRGEIKVAVGRIPHQPQLLGADPSGVWGKPALTRYEVLTQHQDRAHVALFPQTGRTHQLRIHLHWINHPIVGDQRYKHPGNPPAERLFLHAKSLVIKHPEQLRQLELICGWDLDKKV